MDHGKVDRLVRNLKPRLTPYDQALGNSMSCRVTADGGRVLYLRIEVRSKQQRFKLGYYPATTIAPAHAKAMEIRSQIKNGFDPRVEARRTILGANIPITVSQAAERFIADHIMVKNRASWAKEAERLIRVEVLPQIGSYPLTQLKKADLSAVIARKMAEVKAKKRSGTVANRLSAIISRFIAFCADHGWLEAQIGIRLPKPAVEQVRTRTLNTQELGQLWNALKPIREGQRRVWSVYGRVIAVLALTGCRCAEITGLHRRSIDLQAGTITIENGKTKASSRTLALPPLARGILEEQLATVSADAPEELVFPLPKGGRIPSNEVSRAARKIVKAIGHVPWTPHDLRRTVVSVMAELGIDGDIRRRITGHQAQDVHGKVYDQANRQNAVRAALLQVEGYVSDAALKVAVALPENVVSIKTKPLS